MTEGRAGITEGRAGRDASPVVIPDVFNRESMGVPPRRDTRMKRQRKDTGFPLTTGGNDRRGEAGMTEGRVGMTGGESGNDRVGEWE